MAKPPVYSLDVCQWCSTPTWTRPGGKKGPICRACHIEIFFERTLYAPIGFQLLPWQRKALREIYGTVDIDTGRRQYESAYIEVAKKNGKSFLLGGLPLYHLTVEGVENAKAYGAAAAKDQAGLIFAAAAQLYRANPLLREELKLLESTKRIVRRDGAGHYAVIAADGDVQDGIEPTLTLIDELHRWKTAKARTLHQVLTAGDISVEDPLKLQITTAGDRYESELCYLAHERARQVIEGSIKLPKFYAAIYAADATRHKNDPEYWKSRDARVAANPSHEDCGGFLKDDRITGKLEELGETAYKRLHLNIWNESNERWMDMSRWNECAATPSSFVGKKCIIGLDLSKNTDFTALVVMFLEDDNTLNIQPYFWIPEGQVGKLEKKLKLDLQRWIRSGKLETTPGESISKETIKEKIAMIAEAATISEIAYDPRFAWDLIDDLKKDHTCVEVQQYGRVMDAPMQWLMAKVLNHEVKHGGHEVMDWHMECTTVVLDRDGLQRPDKEHLARDARRIDGVSALITGCVRQILYQPVEMGVIVGDL